MKHCAIALTVSLLASAPAVAQSVKADTAALAAVQSLRCTFTLSSYWDFKGTMVLQGAAASTSFDLIFDSIDRPKRHARLIGNIGADDVSVIPGDATLSFLEITKKGSPMLTVVFARRVATPKGWAFSAITSRHQMEPKLNIILAGQMTGTCSELL